MAASLKDLGERNIVRTILPRFVGGVGDDCAVLDCNTQQVIVTTDPVPEPAAKLIGGDPDPYWMGWLLVTINASDLSAAGAVPLGFLAAIEAPSETSVEDFERLLQGISECCDAEGLVYAGGNLREGGRLTAVGTAIGLCKPGKTLHRRGAEDSHVLVSVGDAGVFWQDALTLRRGGTVEDKSSSPVFRPRSQLRVMHQLAKAGVISAAIDNSDGLLPTLNQLAEANNLAVELDLDMIPTVARSNGVEPQRLWLGWGDWNVIATVPSEELGTAQKIALDCDSLATPIGRLAKGTPQVVIKKGNSVTPAPRLESERFAQDSWFARGIDAYIDMLLNVKLP